MSESTTVQSRDILQPTIIASSLREQPTNSVGMRALYTMLPIISAYMYTWFLGANKIPLRMAQSLGWFAVSLAIKSAATSFKKTPENSIWAAGVFVLFLSIQNITLVFEPFAIFAIIIYAALCFIIQIEMISRKDNSLKIVGHSALAGIMFYFLLEEYIFLDGLWFWIAVASGASIAMMSIRRSASLKK